MKPEETIAFKKYSKWYDLTDLDIVMKHLKHLNNIFIFLHDENYKETPHGQYDLIEPPTAMDLAVQAKKKIKWILDSYETQTNKKITLLNQNNTISSSTPGWLII